MSDTLKLYRDSGSPNSRRVRIFLAEKGFEISLIPVDLGKREQHTEAYRRQPSTVVLGRSVPPSTSLCQRPFSSS
jgi:glutathione S-transferase